jgi:hypothetical protein
LLYCMTYEFFLLHDSVIQKSTILASQKRLIRIVCLKIFSYIAVRFRLCLLTLARLVFHLACQRTLLFSVKSQGLQN